MTEKKHNVGYKISSTKLMILSILSFNIYDVIPLYYYWKSFKKEYDKDIMIKTRTAFSIIALVRIFFIAGLGKKLQQIFNQYNIKHTKIETYTTAYIVIMLIFHVIGKFLDKTPDAPIFFIISFITVFIAVFLQAYSIKKANDEINQFYKKHTKKIILQNELKWYDVILGFFGVAFWIIIIFGTYLGVVGL